MFDSVQIEILESSKGPHGNQLQSKGATAYCIQLGRQTQNQSCRETQRSRFQTGDPELPCLFTLPHQCGRLEGRRPLAESAVGLRWRATYRTLASDTHPSGLGTMEAIVLVRGPGRGL